MKFVYIPYQDKEEAKNLGAKWNAKAKSWYIPDGVDESLFCKWTNIKSPEQRFLDDLIAHGCILKNGEPICDGQSHRIQVIGDKSTACSGFYVFHLDGTPNGYFMNNRTKDSFKKCYFTERISSDIQRSEDVKKRQAEFKKKQEQLKFERHESELKIALKISEDLKNLSNTNEIKSPYFIKKGIPGSIYTYVSLDTSEIDSKKYITWIPLYNIDGQLTTAQLIFPDGTKRFIKGGRKHGSFHIVEGHISNDDKTIIICEGYATAASIQLCLRNKYSDVKVIAAIDSGNLISVAKELKNKYKDKNFVIACDNDQYANINVGCVEGTKAANAIDAKIVIPNFADDVEGSDFNDLMLSAGKEIVIKSFLSSLLV